ncbi:MAG: SDR family oxidoreductase [Okeania sp. SIO2G4]|uniref:SDR family oxidoreductase n=1 Tax=unclassified Okeania TaxID=2634635 RepID=UPI0013B737B1|nr:MULTISPECIES: SDR family oxidoreductase [unclassified Okeania]NEP04749.1 SDR family oxidoreductase [Okeania sp. SIO4D6]NEP39315.1 SDR family oxidoreductase [Okeania sp. SIO2H7]NEP70795.1 SDR family oxidoreductase [Okeania sp. SIO2G5]NEP93557.1 SDR family oxidoreductase [Okeania sp. SIO2F5]NEQ93667.1 SDR family oxidoreductase [Okeania sp. SIO2G4]
MWQHAIITGGSSGIGKEIAKLLATEGSNISIIARNPKKLEAARAEITATIVNPEQKIITISTDVAHREATETAIHQAVKEIGTPDLLITAAGISHPGYFRELPIEIFEQTMAINYFGSLYCVRAVLPMMEQEKKGHIVMISSGAGLIGIYGYTPYCPSKFAIRGLAESLRGELKLSGISVSVVYPPDTDTPQLEVENKTKPLETKRITATSGVWSAEDMAVEIVRGMKKKTFAIAPGLEMTLLDKLHSLLAPIIRWYMDLIVIQTLGSRGSTINNE